MILAVFSITAIADNPPDKKEKKWTITVEGNIFSTILHRSEMEETILPVKTNFYSQDNTPFALGRAKMQSLIASMTEPEKTNPWDIFIFDTKEIIETDVTEINPWDKFVYNGKESFENENLLYSLGAITYFNNIAYKHHDPSDSNAKEDLDLNKLILEMSAYVNRGHKDASYYGVCRDFAFATAKLAEETFSFPALVIAGHEHTIAHLVTPEGIVLINEGLKSHIDGYKLKTKDDVDVANMRIMGIMQVQDLTIDPKKNSVVYENRYNNFAGFWSKLQNRDNSDRIRNFLFTERAPLFSYINEKGVNRVSLEKEKLGLQLYGVGRNNEYNRFLINNYGANIALVPISRVSKEKAFNHQTFFNLGVYSLKSVSDNKLSRINKSWNAQVSVENYLKYNFKNNLSTGLLSRFSRLTQKIGSIKSKGAFDDSWINFYSSPFIGWEKENDKGKKFFLAGWRATMYFALPKANKVSGVPWFSLGSEHSSKDKSLAYYFKTEIQKASIRTDLVINYKTKKGYLDIRSFYENYNNDFKEKSLFVDTYGLDLIFGQTILKNKEVFLSSSFKSTNSSKQKIILSLGFKF